MALIDNAARGASGRALAVAYHQHQTGEGKREKCSWRRGAGGVGGGAHRPQAWGRRWRLTGEEAKTISSIGGTLVALLRQHIMAA